MRVKIESCSLLESCQKFDKSFFWGIGAMWRFMVVTFGFLGFTFYELSGGADYAPGPNSIQARAGLPAEAPQSGDAPGTARENERHLASVEDLRTTHLQKLDTTPADRFEVTLAAAQATSFKSETVSTATATQARKVALLTAPDDTGTVDPVDAAVTRALLDDATATQQDVRKIWPGAIELFAQQQNRREAAAIATREAGDLRYVTGNVVNMRGGPGTGYARITSLRKGAQVAVLDSTADGWLKLRVAETGQEGWMADWLVSAPGD